MLMMGYVLRSSCLTDVTNENILTNIHLNGVPHCSVDSSAPSILPPWVWVPSTPSLLFWIYIVQIVNLSFELECEKNENKQKEARIGQLKNHSL